jgi:hypothetical protein
MPSEKNVTVPVGTPVVLELTVAVKVTDCPWFVVGELEETVVDVPALFTLYVTVVDVLPPKLESPP